MVRCYNLLAEIGKEDRFTAKEIEFLAAKGVRACVIELTHGVSWVNLHELELKHACQHSNMLYHFKHKADFKSKDEAIREAWHFGEYLHNMNLNDETALVLDVSSMMIDDTTIENIRAFHSVIMDFGYKRTGLQFRTENLQTNFDNCDYGNLWAINYYACNAGIDGVGTWRFTNNWHGLEVKMSYDFLGYYTEILGNQGIQLDLSNTYTVRPGDTLWLVAYQHGISVEELLKINGLTYDSTLRVGQKLQVA